MFQQSDLPATQQETKCQPKPWGIICLTGSRIQDRSKNTPMVWLWLLQKNPPKMAICFFSHPRAAGEIYGKDMFFKACFRKKHYVFFDINNNKSQEQFNKQTSSFTRVSFVQIGFVPSSLAFVFCRFKNVVSLRNVGPCVLPQGKRYTRGLVGLRQTPNEHELFGQKKEPRETWRKPDLGFSFFSWGFVEGWQTIQLYREYFTSQYLGGGFLFFKFHPLGKWSNLTSICFKWVETTN